MADARNSRPVHAAALKGPVQVHHMEIPGAFHFPFQRHGCRMAAVDRGLRGLPLAQSDALAVLYINGRKYDHLLPLLNHSAIFFQICIPTGPDFSGWN